MTLSFLRSPTITPLSASLEDFDREDILGEGGTAVVFRARHRATGQAVALKVLRTAGLDPSWAQRFAREARAVSALRHPNIARVIGYGESSEGLCLAFELIDGGTLSDLKARMGGTLPVPVAVEVLSQLLAALEYAHAAGTIHRDLKPSNVMLTSEGVVKLVDFGIAKVHDDVPLTQTGAIIGTPAFMSPEQVEGDAVDERSDLFSVGLVLHDMIVGDSPYLADTTAATIMRLMYEEVPLLTEGAGGIPWALERLHGSLVARERERRPIGADVVREVLQPLTRAGRQRWPRLLADAIAQPAATAARLRREAAFEQCQRAHVLYSRHGPHPCAVLALHDAARVDATFDEAVRLLPQFETEANVTVRRATDDDAVREIRAGLKLQPRQAVLWGRLADLHRLRGEPFDEVVALKRVLRLRSDADAEARLVQLIWGPDTTATRPGSADSDIHDPSTTSVHTRPHPSPWSRRWTEGRPWAALTGASLMLGIVMGVAAVSIARQSNEDLNADALPPTLAAPAVAGKDMVLKGLAAEVGPTSTTFLSASNTLTLGGTLEVQLVPGFTPSRDDVFVIARAAAVHGAFVDGARAVVRVGSAEAGTFDVEVRAHELALVRYDPLGRVPRRHGPQVPLAGPAVLNLWGGDCDSEQATWPRLRRALPKDVNVVHVVRSERQRLSLDSSTFEETKPRMGKSRRRPGARDTRRDSPRIRDSVVTPLIDGDGTRFFEPLGVTGCATVVIDVDGRVRLRTTTTSPDAAEQVRRTFTALATNVPFLEDTTASVGERVQRLRACRPLLRCALDETTAWSTGAPGDVASVDACLLECDPGAAPRPVVLAAARAALADDDADRAVRLLEPWGSAPYPDVQRLLGDAYLKGNRLEQARFHLQRYLELAPQAGDAPEVRRELAP